MAGRAVRKIAHACSGALADDELVMINVDTGKFVALRDTGLRTWELLDTTGDLDEICTRLQDEFAVEPGQCRIAVERFIDQLVARGFVEHA